MHDLGTVWHNVSHSDPFQLGQLIAFRLHLFYRSLQCQLIYLKGALLPNKHTALTEELYYPQSIEIQPKCKEHLMSHRQSQIKDHESLEGKGDWEVKECARTCSTIKCTVIAPNTSGHIYISAKSILNFNLFTHTTLTVRIDAKLEKDRVSCFQTYHWVRDEGQGGHIFQGSPLDSMTFLHQLI